MSLFSEAFVLAMTITIGITIIVSSACRLTEKILDRRDITQLPPASAEHPALDGPLGVIADATGINR